MSDTTRLEKALAAADAAGDEQAARALAAEIRRQREQAPTTAPGPAARTSAPKAFGLGAVDTATSGFADEAVGIGKGANVLRQQSRQQATQGGIPGAVTAGIRSAAAPFEALARRVTGTEDEATQAARVAGEQGVRDQMATAREDRPGWFMGGQVAGGVAQAVLPVGRAAQGARLAARVGAGARTGAALGGLYGLGSGETTAERFQQGGTGAVIGGAVGAAAVPVAEAVTALPGVRQATQAIGGAIQRATDPKVVNSGLGMTIGPPPMGFGGSRAARPPGPSGDTIARRLAQLADRNRMAPADVSERLAATRADSRGQVVAELFGEPGVMSAATVARMPGQTGSLATERMIERNAGQSTRLGKDLTGQTAQDAGEFLANQVRVTTQQYLAPVLSRPYAPAERRAAMQAWDALAQRESIKAAMPAVRNQIKELIQRGEAPADALTDPAYLAHYAKMQLQRQIKDPSLVKTSAQQVDNGNLIAASRDLRAFAEQIRPGYAQAMEELQKVLIPRSIADLIENARGVDPNIARQLRGNPEVRRALEREFMGTFGEALRTEDQLFRNAQRMIPATGSQSTPLAMGALDEMASGGVGIPATKQGALSWVADRIAAPIQESRRNELGQVLFSDVGELSPAQLQRIQDELRRITDLRAARARAASTTGGAAGTAASSRQ